AVASALSRIAFIEKDHGEDPRPKLARARAAIEQAAALGYRSGRAQRLLGEFHLDAADYQSQHGIDPIGEIDAAASNLQHALEIDPSDDDALQKLARCEEIRVGYL